MQWVATDPGPLGDFSSEVIVADRPTECSGSPKIKKKLHKKCKIQVLLEISRLK